MFPSLPSDNLYKFIFFAGVTLLVFGLYSNLQSFQQESLTMHNIDVESGLDTMSYSFYKEKLKKGTIEYSDLNAVDSMAKRSYRMMLDTKFLHIQDEVNRDNIIFTY